MIRKDKMKMMVGALVLIGLTAVIWKYSYTNVMGIKTVKNQVFANDSITQSSDETTYLNEYELAEYNGMNGQPAYIAVSGIIYDVTSLWSNGLHEGYQAGTDLTMAFASSPHSMEILSDLPVVGVLGLSIQASETSQSPQVQIPAEDSKEWTTERLALYDGKNGQPAYIAVSGIIYDVTNPWSNGSHKGYQAGVDLTAAFARSPHSMAILSGLPVIGLLVQNTQAYEPINTPEPEQAQEFTPPPQVQISDASADEWTTEKLALYDGKNGHPAYIVVSGVIYDVSGSWSNGSHQGYQAGKDLTSAFASSPHSMATLSGLPVIGVLGQVVQAPEPTQLPQVENPVVSADEWTIEKLAQYDGKNGQPAYIAVSGVIYDVSSSWSNGSHQGYQAGKDLTSAFASSPHSMATLSGLPVIGVLGQVVQAPEPTQLPQVENPVVSADEWTTEKLAQYDGKNGQPAYIAVSGVIYDVSSSWSNGSHQGYQAGKDLTTAFASSPHSMATLSGLPVIGELGQVVQAPESTQPPQVENPVVSADEWTTEKLALYDGKNGQPAYIAVSGVIYDVTSSWSNGSHKGYQAGKDLTSAFASSPHSMATLSGLPVIGELGQVVQAPESTQPPQVENPVVSADEWTTEKLAQYDGKNGQPAYIAVSGVIYDVTSSWSNGSHKGYQAGKDLTSAFASSPHSMATLSGLPVIGQYNSATTIPDAINNGNESDDDVYEEDSEEDDEHDIEDEEHEEDDEEEDD